MMNRMLRIVAFTFACSLCVAPASAEPLDFEPLADFPKSDTVQLGPCSAVAVNSRGSVFVFNCGKHPIICPDGQGRYVRSWGEGDIVSSPGLRIDSDDNDMDGHRVLKYDVTGKLLLALGTGKPGDGDDQFDRPTDVAFGKRGEFYVADGYGNSRVMKFSPNEALIGKWGSRGNQQLSVLALDADGNQLIAEVTGKRVQKFLRK